jgi:hypothetical protein
VLARYCSHGSSTHADCVSGSLTGISSKSPMVLLGRGPRLLPYSLQETRQRLAGWHGAYFFYGTSFKGQTSPLVDSLQDFQYPLVDAFEGRRQSRWKESQIRAAEVSGGAGVP